MSLIENVWDLLKQNVAAREPRNLQELWTFAAEEWAMIPAETVSTAYGSMVRRIQAVVKAKGGNTKY